MFSDLEDHEAQVYSQGGEDGVLQRIFERIGVAHKSYVEFGAWDGQHLSNTANLRLHHGWSGLLMEGSDRADESVVKREFVSAENVNALFAKYAVPTDFDLLSIDIDGNDYWVWKAIAPYQPRVVIVEYNIFFGLDQARTIVYDPDYIWDETKYHGASLAAFFKLAHEKGYSLVHTDSWAPNAIFVLDALLPSDFVERPLGEATPWNQYSASPEIPGRSWVDV
jgi:hypothetical protein